MAGTLSLPSGTRTVRIACVVLGLIVAVVAARVWASSYLTRAQPALAYSVHPGNSEAAGLYADALMQQAQNDADVDIVEAVARDALSESPYAPGALRTWGFVQIYRDGEEQGQPAIELAGRVTMRDYFTHAWLLDKRFREGRPEETVRQADIVLNQRTSGWDPIMGGLLQVLSDRRTIAPLAETLERQPYWRGTFLERLGQADTDLDNQYRLLLALKRSSEPPTNREVTAYLRGIYSSLPIAEVHRRWTALVDVPETERGKLLLDGDLTGVDLPPPFGWALNEPNDALVEFANRRDGRGRALYIGYGSTADGSFATQQMAISPGRYRLSGIAMAEDDIGTGRIGWRFHCVDGTVWSNFAATTIATVPDQWVRFDTVVTVPAGCETLAIELHGQRDRSAPELSIWVDALTFDPVR